MAMTTGSASEDQRVDEFARAREILAAMKERRALFSNVLEGSYSVSDRAADDGQQLEAGIGKKQVGGSIDRRVIRRQIKVALKERQMMLSRMLVAAGPIAKIEKDCSSHDDQDSDTQKTDESSIWSQQTKSSFCSPDSSAEQMRRNTNVPLFSGIEEVCQYRKKSSFRAQRLDI
ncbi:predicted protein [Phaeodactylum tricornutum CCAP 1055/1]|jgi:RNase P protein component|uniref:Uncharacterized protein n=1 Tax=Phaeodactylum tricornutum (strain CCAP 1055/1) TaxID=556484 RepID=B7FSK7_PHATC|nr:predicted protein [Phaeodactylum tricornutum CCAP 1055/1]EEC50813.1 predicted protein [Phaeodactylum tricornutum CCAP 1055/1]|eukprot:XP_002177999.1 predicted protein [Phaeodactylum tricornutum CCAP 1055/1]